MSSFRDLHPRLTEEHLEAMHQGRQLQEEELRVLMVRWGIRISSAIRVEMSQTKCTYEEACVKFVRACDEVATSFHFIHWAEEAKADPSSSDLEAA